MALEDDPEASPDYRPMLSNIVARLDEILSELDGLEIRIPANHIAHGADLLRRLIQSADKR